MPVICVQVLPLHIKTASVFYGRIIQEEDNVFDSMVADMTSYYADSKPCPEEVLQGGLYAVLDNDNFHRSCILPFIERDILNRPILGNTFQYRDLAK